LLGPGIAAAIDLFFLAALAAVIAREIIAGKNTRNLKVLAVIGLLFVGNVVFHVEVAYGGGSGFGTRIGVGATVLLIVLMGGRIIPSFTRNWLARCGPGRLPAPVDRFDAGVVAASGIALATSVALPANRATALLAMAAGLMNTLRLARWAGERTVAEPLVLVLHVAYAFVPIGFVLLALGIWVPGVVTPSGALHGWTAGAIGLMTLAVMTRASLGHSGRSLTATRPIQLIYGAAILATAARITAAFGVLREPMLHVSASAWVLAFVGFVSVYAPLLLKRRR
jgi:uncharacterized protein involved in response to NO